MRPRREQQDPSGSEASSSPPRALLGMRLGREAQRRLGSLGTTSLVGTRATSLGWVWF